MDSVLPKAEYICSQQSGQNVARGKQNQANKPANLLVSGYFCLYFVCDATSQFFLMQWYVTFLQVLSLLNN